MHLNHDWNSTILVLDDEIFNLKTLKLLRIQNHNFYFKYSKMILKKPIPTDFGTSLSVSASKFEIQTSPYPLLDMNGMGQITVGGAASGPNVTCH